VREVRVDIDHGRDPAAVSRALREALIGADPCGGIKKPVPVEASRNVVLNEHQLKAFWTRLDAAPMEPDTRTALKLSLVTAQRIGTVASISRQRDLCVAICVDEMPLLATPWLTAVLVKGRSDWRLLECALDSTSASIILRCTINCCNAQGRCLRGRSP
jgi:hypothetical protein